MHYEITDKYNSIVLKVSTYIFGSMAVCPIGLAVILAIMSVSTFITVDTLCLTSDTF